MSASPPYVPGPSTLSDPAAAPSATWNAQMPKLEDFGNDVGKWLAAVKVYAATANGPNMFPASPTDAQMQAAYGPGWTAAGVNAPVSQGEYNSRLLNYEYLHQHQPGVKGPSIGLQFGAREAVRPEEMQAAYNAVNPENGQPMLLPQIGGYLESTYGLKPNTQYQATGTSPDAAGSGGDTAGAVNPAGGTFFDPASGQLVQMSTNPPPGSGFLEVPNNFDPNDPNAVHIRDAMGYINVMARQGSIHGGDSQAEWNYIDSILKPLGIDPAVFVAGVLNYNGYDIAADGTLSQPTGAFTGSTPQGPGTTTPTGTLGAGGGAGGAAPGGAPGGGYQVPGTSAPAPAANTPTGTLGAGGTGGPAGPGSGYQVPGGNPPPQPATQQPAPAPTQTDTSSPPATSTPPQQTTSPPPAGGGDVAHSPHEMSMVSQPPLTTNQPSQVAAMATSPTALAQQFGNTSTIDARYPDWMLQNRPFGAQRGQVSF